MSETADTIAIRIVSETETAQRNVAAYGAKVERTMTGVEVAVTRAAETSEAAAKRQHAAYRDLGTALVKVSADAIEGKNAFQILGEQGTAVAASMVGLGGSIGRVAGFIAGPWGAILTTAVSVIGMLATKSGEAGSEQDKAALAVDRLRAATDALNAVTGASFSNTEHSIRLRQKEIELSEKKAEAVRTETQAELSSMRAKVALIKAVAPLSGSLFAKFYEGDIEEAEQTIANLERASRHAGQVNRDGHFQIARNRAAAALDPLEKARQVRDDSLQQVQYANRKGQIATQAELDEQVALIEADFARKVARLTRRPTPRPTGISMPRATTGKPAKPVLTPAEERLANYENLTPINVAGLVIPTEAEAKAQLWEAIAGLSEIDVTKFEVVDPEQIEVIGRISTALKDDLAKGLADAIVAGRSLGDVLVDSFARAGAALIESQITRLLDPGGDGSTGFIKSATNAFANLLGARTPPKRASGGHVSAGQLYRVNEVGIEGFRPAGSGSIVPLGQMAARPTGGVTVIQPLNVSFAGAITTPQLMAQFKAYADGVGQAAVIGGAAMAQAKMAKRAARALPR